MKYYMLKGASFKITNLWFVGGGGGQAHKTYQIGKSDNMSSITCLDLGHVFEYNNLLSQ